MQVKTYNDIHLHYVAFSLKNTLGKNKDSSNNSIWNRIGLNERNSSALD